jgi:hypothetical protein
MWVSQVTKLYELVICSKTMCETRIASCKYLGVAPPRLRLLMVARRPPGKLISEGGQETATAQCVGSLGLDL